MHSAENRLGFDEPLVTGVEMGSEDSGGLSRAQFRVCVGGAVEAVADPCLRRGDTSGLTGATPSLMGATTGWVIGESTFNTCSSARGLKLIARKPAHRTGRTSTSTILDCRMPLISRIHRGIVAIVPALSTSLTTLASGRACHGIGGIMTFASSRWVMAATAISLAANCGRIHSK